MALNNPCIIRLDNNDIFWGASLNSVNHRLTKMRLISVLKIKVHKNVPIHLRQLKSNTILMRPDKKDILFTPSKFYLLLLYIPFFIVQGFFNFDVPGSHYIKTVSTVVSRSAKNQQKASYFTTNKSTDKKAGIRLSKRFQPENAPILIPPPFELAICFIRVNIFNTYTDQLIPSSYLLTKKLRGPPVIAQNFA